MPVGMVALVAFVLMVFGALSALPRNHSWSYIPSGALRTAMPRAVFGLAVLLVCGAAGAQSVAGATTAKLKWAAASGPVAGYGVFIARNGAPYPASPNLTTSTTTAQVTGAYGDTLTVKVAAFTTSGTYGPFSPDSAPISFVPAPPLVVAQPGHEPGPFDLTDDTSSRRQGR